MTLEKYLEANTPTALHNFLLSGTAEYHKIHKKEDYKDLESFINYQVSYISNKAIKYGYETNSLGYFELRKYIEEYFNNFLDNVIWYEKHFKKWLQRIKETYQYKNIHEMRKEFRSEYQERNATYKDLHRIFLAVYNKENQN